MRRSWSAWLCQSTWICVLACVVATCAGTAVAQSQGSQSLSEQPLQEVTVTAKRLKDHHTLARAVTHFVESHASPGTRINQIGRWYEPMCPLVTGLQPAGRDFITREILDVA